MLQKIKSTAVIVLATLGVLFIIIMLMPDDEEEGPETVAVETEVSAEVNNEAASEKEPSEAVAEPEVKPEQEAGAEQEAKPEAEADAKETESAVTEAASEPTPEPETSASESAEDEKPESKPEFDSESLRFKTTTLDGKTVTSDIFADYDTTVVFLWGTYCESCIREMGNYASFYKEKPDNVNFIGIICDVYDGIDNNVRDANAILSDAGAEFMNLKTSDSIFDITNEYQYIPSSFFVDRKGHVVEKLEGAGYSQTMKALNEVLK